MGCSRSVAMAMIVSLFCSQMSDIPEGCCWFVQAGWEELIRIANGRQVLCLLCVSILKTIRRIKALSWRDETEARWASLVGSVESVHALCLLPLVFLSGPLLSLCSPSCGWLCRVDGFWSTWTQLEGEKRRQQRAPKSNTLNHLQLGCPLAPRIIKHSWL